MVEEGAGAGSAGGVVGGGFGGGGGEAGGCGGGGGGVVVWGEFLVSLFLDADGMGWDGMGELLTGG